MSKYDYDAGLPERDVNHIIAWVCDACKREDLNRAFSAVERHPELKWRILHTILFQASHMGSESDVRAVFDRYPEVKESPDTLTKMLCEALRLQDDLVCSVLFEILEIETLDDYNDFVESRRRIQLVHDESDAVELPRDFGIAEATGHGYSCRFLSWLGEKGLLTRALVEATLDADREALIRIAASCDRGSWNHALVSSKVSTLEEILASFPSEE